MHNSQYTIVINKCTRISIHSYDFSDVVQNKIKYWTLQDGQCWRSFGANLHSGDGTSLIGTLFTSPPSIFWGSGLDIYISQIILNSPLRDENWDFLRLAQLLLFVHTINYEGIKHLAKYLATWLYQPWKKVLIFFYIANFVSLTDLWTYDFVPLVM